MIFLSKTVKYTGIISDCFCVKPNTDRQMTQMINKCTASHKD